jgi:hypothetical protein
MKVELFIENKSTYFPIRLKWVLITVSVDNDRIIPGSCLSYYLPLSSDLES